MIIPRYYQTDAFNIFKDYVTHNPGKHPLIVLPTGSGKSYIQAMIVKWMLTWDHTRILLLTHRKELIKQNYIELTDLLDQHNLFSDIGIYSAGLNCRDTKNRVLFAGIQSVYKKAEIFGHFDLILVDEVHRVPSKKIGMYRKFLDDMFYINNKIIIAGLSATPFRMGTGLLTEGKETIFNDICYEVSVEELISGNHYKNKDQKQYLCNLISKGTKNSADLSKVHIRHGEYKADEMEQAFIENDLVPKAVEEIISLTKNRKKILIFSAGIQHCEMISMELNKQGITADYIHSKRCKKINDQVIKDFRKGKFVALVNVNILTEGFNDKEIDCICLMRGTCSAGLYVQMTGRGLRLHPSKENALILDFGNNIIRHGPLNCINLKNSKKGAFLAKECPKCHEIVTLAVKECPACGHVFEEPEEPKERKVAHETEASDAEIIKEWKAPEEIEVLEVAYHRHFKKGKPDSLRVDYYVSAFTRYSEWVCIEHEGFARQKALQWLRTRMSEDYQIETISDALAICDYFKIPKKIIIDLNNKYPKIIGFLDLIEPEIKEDYDYGQEKTDEQWDNNLQKFVKICKNL